MRPLFEPSKEDLDREAAEAEAREIARREYMASAEVAERVDGAVNAWRVSRDRSSAIALLRVTSESGREGDLLRAAKEILTVQKETGISGFTDNDVALLIHSHMRLLPTQERGSGAYFWLNEEVARLVSK